MNNNAAYADRAAGGKVRDKYRIIFVDITYTPYYLQSRLIIEFSLENSEKVNILNARDKKRKEIAAKASRTAKESNAAKSNKAVKGSPQDKKRKRREGPGERRKRKKEAADSRASGH